MTRFRTERLAEGWIWWRIAEATWTDPLDPGYAQRAGGRWNPPGSYPTLYFNEDQQTARLNLRAFIDKKPYEPEDLRPEAAPVLVGATLPRNQTVCDAHSPAGLRALGMPSSYPFDDKGRVVPHARCQPLGQAVKDAGLRGLRVRSAQSADGTGRELAWFPASARSLARPVRRINFRKWYLNPVGE